MVRYIDNESDLDPSSAAAMRERYELAMVEDVDQEALQKKFMKKAERNKAEFAKEREQLRISSIKEYTDFLGLEENGIEVDVNSDNPLSSAGVSYCFKVDGEAETVSSAVQTKKFKEAAERKREKNKEKHGATEEYKKEYNDGFMAKEVENFAHRIKNTMRERPPQPGREFNHRDGTDVEHVEAIYEGNAFESSYKHNASSSNRSSSSSSFSNSTGNPFTQSRQQTTTSSRFEESDKGTGQPRSEMSQKQRDMYGAAAAKMRDFAFASPKKEKKPKRRGFGRKRWSLQGMLQSTKEWFNSDQGLLMMKVGALLCLETGLALITKKFEFDGPLQAVGFIGMMMGIFAISREVKAEGFDSRRLNFL